MAKRFAVFCVVCGTSLVLAPEFSAPSGVSWVAQALAKGKRPKGKTPAEKKTPPPAAVTPAPVPTPAATPTPSAPAPAPAAPVKAATPAKAAAAGKADPNLSTAELLARARSLYDALEYEAVIPVAEAVLARGDANIDVRLDAYLLQGSSLAIVGDAIEAEKPFRFLLRGRPDYDMPAETAPKILAVFRKVQVEERAIVTQMKELERARVLRELKLDGDIPSEANGGLPLPFEFKLRDPGRAVQSINVYYRRSPVEPFSSLALQIDDTGLWRGELPGEWTENADGFTLQYYVATADATGQALLTSGDPTSPLAVQMAPGSVADARPLYKSPWLWVAVGVFAAGAAVGSYFLYESMTALPKTDGLIEL